MVGVAWCVVGVRVQFTAMRANAPEVIVAVFALLQRPRPKQCTRDEPTQHNAKWQASVGKMASSKGRRHEIAGGTGTNKTRTTARLCAEPQEEPAEVLHEQPYAIITHSYRRW